MFRVFFGSCAPDKQFGFHLHRLQENRGLEDFDTIFGLYLAHVIERMG